MSCSRFNASRRIGTNILHPSIDKNSLRRGGVGVGAVATVRRVVEAVRAGSGAGGGAVSGTGVAVLCGVFPDTMAVPSSCSKEQEKSSVVSSTWGAKRKSSYAARIGRPRTARLTSKNSGWAEKR